MSNVPTPLPSMLSSNQQLQNSHPTSTAIFTGATQGIGLGTLQAFLQHIPRPTAYIVGRSRSNFTTHLQNSLQTINPSATLIFIEAQLSLISEVDRVCAEINAHVLSSGDGVKVDILCMSQGYAPFGARKWTSEGLDEVMALVYYGRMRMAERLITLGSMASSARIISVGGAGKEGHVLRDDLEMRENWTVYAFRSHITSVMTLTFDAFSARWPGMGFVHCYPGMVSTGLLRGEGMSGLFGLYVAALRMYVGWFGITPGESGERILWMATDGKFAEGSFSVLHDGSVSRSGELAEYRRDGELRKAIAEHLDVMYERARAARD